MLPVTADSPLSLQESEVFKLAEKSNPFPNKTGREVTSTLSEQFCL